MTWRFPYYQDSVLLCSKELGLVSFAEHGKQENSALIILLMTTSTRSTTAHSTLKPTEASMHPSKLLLNCHHVFKRLQHSLHPEERRKLLFLPPPPRTLSSKVTQVKFNSKVLPSENLTRRKHLTFNLSINVPTTQVQAKREEEHSIKEL